MLRKVFEVTVLCLFFLGLAVLSQAQEENRKEAEEMFQKALNLKSRGGSVCLEILRQKEYFYRKAIGLYPDYAEAHNNLGDVYEKLGRYQEALAEYQKAAELRPDTAIPYFGLGDVYFKMERYEEAIKWYDKGLSLDPDDKLSQQKLKEAKEILNQGDVIQDEAISSVVTRGLRGVAGIRESLGPGLNLKIQFEFDSAAISPQAISQLNELGKALSSTKFSKNEFIKIAGHTDSQGTREYNQRLSEERAESVKGYLVNHFNISPQKLIAIGYGEDRLIAFKNDEVSHAINRRVEIEGIKEEDLDLVKPKMLSVDVAFLYEDKNGKEAKMQDGMILTSKDNYKVYFKPKQDCHVYVYQKDSAGKIDQLFPNPRFTPEGNPVKANTDYWIPRPDKWFYLDETLGKETIYLVAVNERANDLEHISSRYERASTAEEKESLVNDLTFQIKTRGAAPRVRPAHFSRPGPAESKARPLDREIVERNGGFYTEITFQHR